MIVSDVETLRLHYALHAASLARARDQGAREDREDVRRALLPDVGILSRRRHRDVRERRRPAITRCNISATAVRCRSRATICSRPSESIANLARLPAPAAKKPRSAGRKKALEPTDA